MNPGKYQHLRTRTYSTNQNDIMEHHCSETYYFIGNDILSGFYCTKHLFLMFSRWRGSIEGYIWYRANCICFLEERATMEIQRVWCDSPLKFIAFFMIFKMNNYNFHGKCRDYLCWSEIWIRCVHMNGILERIKLMNDVMILRYVDQSSVFESLTTNWYKELRLLKLGEDAPFELGDVQFDYWRCNSVMSGN